ncbi:hypothetical protein LguiA_020235 [Lonicera macranthoides]
MMVMKDRLEEKRSEPEEANGSSPPTNTKTCTDCHTMKTPLWRGGPNGPKSLCNACGIKYHKKRRAILGLDRGRKEKGNHKKDQQNNKKKKIRVNGNNEVGSSLKLRLMGMKKKRSANFGEEEQAAMLLMALSCGSLYF